MPTRGALGLSLISLFLVLALAPAFLTPLPFRGRGRTRERRQITVRLQKKRRKDVVIDTSFDWYGPGQDSDSASDAGGWGSSGSSTSSFSGRGMGEEEHDVLEDEETQGRDDISWGIDAAAAPPNPSTPQPNYHGATSATSAFSRASSPAQSGSSEGDAIDEALKHEFMNMIVESSTEAGDDGSGTVYYGYEDDGDEDAEADRASNGGPELGNRLYRPILSFGGEDEEQPAEQQGAQGPSKSTLIDFEDEDGVNIFQMGDDDDDDEFYPVLDGVEFVSLELEDFVARGGLVAVKSTARCDKYASFSQRRKPRGVYAAAVNPKLQEMLIDGLDMIDSELACNFGDFCPGENVPGGGADWSLEAMSAAKARKVYEATGLPSIAESSGFEVEPVTNAGSARKNACYRFNRVDAHVDKLVQFLMPVSSPDRRCTAKSVVCFFDGDSFDFEYSEVEVSIVCAGSDKALITGSCAINYFVETLVASFESLLEQEGPPDKLPYCGAEMLRDRILKEGRVLPNNIIDVSSFMETTLDMDLMEECAAELAARFEELRPTKILTVGTTGLALAAPMALRLSMPVIYARKSRTMVMTDYLSASYVSRTAQGVKRELVLGRSHIDPDDRVLIVDNFLSSGGIQDAMLRIILEAGAQPVGVAVLMEKAYESGRLYLSGYNIPIESLAKVVSVEEERIVLEGENEEPTQADKMHSEAEWAGGSSPSSSSS